MSVTTASSSHTVGDLNRVASPIRLKDVRRHERHNLAVAILRRNRIPSVIKIMN